MILRDSIGSRLVPGYTVQVVESEDAESGRPEVSRIASGGSTFSTIIIRLAELLALVLVLGVPAAAIGLTERCLELHPKITPPTV